MPPLNQKNASPASGMNWIISVTARHPSVQRPVRSMPSRPITTEKKYKKHAINAVSSTNVPMKYSCSEKMPGCTLLSSVPV